VRSDDAHGLPVIGRRRAGRGLRRALGDGQSDVLELQRCERLGVEDLAQEQLALCRKVEEANLVDDDFAVQLDGDVGAEAAEQQAVHNLRLEILC